MVVFVPWLLNHQDRAPTILCVGVWVDPRLVWTVDKRKFSGPDKLPVYKVMNARTLEIRSKWLCIFYSTYTYHMSSVLTAVVLSCSKSRNVLFIHHKLSLQTLTQDRGVLNLNDPGIHSYGLVHSGNPWRVNCSKDYIIVFYIDVHIMSGTGKHHHLLPHKCEKSMDEVAVYKLT